MQSQFESKVKGTVWLRVDGTNAADRTNVRVSGNFPVCNASDMPSGLRFVASNITKMPAYRGVSELKAAVIEPVDVRAHVAATRMVANDASLKHPIEVVLFKHHLDMYDVMEQVADGIAMSADEFTERHHRPAPSSKAIAVAPLNLPNEIVYRCINAFNRVRPYVQTYVRFGPPLISAANICIVAGQFTVDEITSNPYIVAVPDDETGKSIVGIDVADAIAHHIGMAPTAKVRMDAYAVVAVSKLSSDTSGCWHEPNAIIERMSNLLGKSTEWGPGAHDGVDAAMADAVSAVHKTADLPNGLERYADDADVCEIALVHRADQERRLATTLRTMHMTSERTRISQDALLQLGFLDEAVASGINSAQLRPSVAALLGDYTLLDETQRSVAKELMLTGVVCLVGGAGVGKTTTTRFVSRFLDVMVRNVLLCAPTNQAAKRMRAVTGIVTRTMHSAAYSRSDEVYHACIIDEASMGDIDIYVLLLEPKQTTLQYLLICGDDNQLPSVGMGAVLRDIVRSNTIATVRLENVYRQGDGADIARKSSMIPLGTFPREECTGDLSVEFCEDSNAACEKIVTGYADAVQRCGLMSTTMLAMRNLTVDRLNEMAQQIINPIGARAQDKCELVPTNPPDESEADKNKRIAWRVNDPVISRDKVVASGLQNGGRGTADSVIVKGDRGNAGGVIVKGDRGIVKKIVLAAPPSVAHKVEVHFESGDVHQYHRNCTKQLRHAYCITVHSSQGTEVDDVRFYMDSLYMASRQIFYTGVTRAKRSAHVFTTLNTLKKAVYHCSNEERKTHLTELLLLAAPTENNDAP